MDITRPWICRRVAIQLAGNTLCEEQMSVFSTRRSVDAKLLMCESSLIRLFN